ncbi:hypothetical protein ACOSQ4_029486 [Xanthoceras sorbifolium]
MVNPVVRWMASRNNVFQINTDAAFDVFANRWVVSVIIRDANGLVMATCIVPKPDGFSPQMARRLAVLRGL